MPAKKPKPDEKPQSERFIETAREMEADETKEGFEAAFRMIVTQGTALGGGTTCTGPIASKSKSTNLPVSRKKLG